MNLDEIYKVISNTLGIQGRMLSGSKSAYRDRFPTHVVVFNANIIVKIGDQYDKIWYGDIDLTLDENSLKSVALDGECELYVLYEMDGRFEFDESPQIDKYVFKTDGVKSYFPESQYIKYSRNDAEQIIIAK